MLIPRTSYPNAKRVDQYVRQLSFGMLGLLLIGSIGSAGVNPVTGRFEPSTSERFGPRRFSTPSERPVDSPAGRVNEFTNSPSSQSNRSTVPNAPKKRSVLIFPDQIPHPTPEPLTSDPTIPGITSDPRFRLDTSNADQIAPPPSQDVVPAKKQVGLRTWTDLNGKGLGIGDFLRLENGDIVIVKLANGRETPFSLTELSEEDQLFVASQTEQVQTPVAEVPVAQEDPVLIAPPAGSDLRTLRIRRFAQQYNGTRRSSTTGSTFIRPFYRDWRYRNVPKQIVIPASERLPNELFPLQEVETAEVSADRQLAPLAQ